MPTFPSLALTATVLLLLALLVLRLRQRPGRGEVRATLDTIADWPPQSVRVLSINERQAYDTLRRAMPGFLVLAQVPLARFVRVPARHSYGDWMQRAGSLSADLLLCDAGSRVLAVIDIRAVQESDRSRKRHERMARVLRTAGITVLTWREGELPNVNEARQALAVLTGPAAQARMPPAQAAAVAPMADISAILAAGDRAAAEASLDPSMEPVPSAFFEDALEAAGPARR